MSEKKNWLLFALIAILVVVLIGKYALMWQSDAEEAKIDKARKERNALIVERVELIRAITKFRACEGNVACQKQYPEAAKALKEEAEKRAKRPRQ